MFTFATDYFILVFAATIGVLQIAASLGRLNGILFIKRLWATQALGLALVVGAFVWFFGTTERNVNDHSGGLDAPTQALFFFYGSFAGLVFTLLASSLVNLRMNDQRLSPEAGLDALKYTNYVRALSQSLVYWRKQCHRQMRSYFSG